MQVLSKASGGGRFMQYAVERRNDARVCQGAQQTNYVVPWLP